MKRKQQEPDESVTIVRIVRRPDFLDSLKPERTKGRWDYILDGVLKLEKTESIILPKEKFPGKSINQFKSYIHVKARKIGAKLSKIRVYQDVEGKIGEKNAYWIWKIDAWK